MSEMKDTRLTDARQRWLECQSKLAVIETALIRITGEAQSIGDNLDLVHSRIATLLFALRTVADVLNHRSALSPGELLDVVETAIRKTEGLS
jgi:hypothetical protein